MIAAVGVIVLAVLFAVFPLIARERDSGDCVGCDLRTKLGAGCGRCPDPREPSHP